jgi:hypothetical protein
VKKFMFSATPEQQSKPTGDYGQIHDVFASRKPDDETIVVGGVDSQAHSWTRGLTPRAATQLWIHLTRTLFPEKAIKVFSIAKTAPLMSPDHPTLTNNLEFQPSSDSQTYRIIGKVGVETWWFTVDSQTARALWAALDVALYPSGWQGSTTSHNNKLMN